MDQATSSLPSSTSTSAMGASWSAQIAGEVAVLRAGGLEAGFALSASGRRNKLNMLHSPEQLDTRSSISIGVSLSSSI